MKAFHGDLACKQTLLNRIDEAAASSETAFPLTKKPAQADEIEKLAEEFGLHPAFALLVSGMMQGEEATAFLASLVKAIPPGADTGAQTRRWILWSWTDAAPALRERIQDEDLRAAGDEVAQMHRRVLAGEEISRQQWRAARAAFAGATLTGVPGLAVDAIAAAAWDLETTPGAATDLLTASLYIAATEADLQSDWTAEDEEAFRTTMQEAGRLRGLEKSLDQAGAVNGAADLDERRAHIQAEMKALIDSKADLFARMRQHYEQRASASGAALAKAREGLLALAESTAPQAHETV